MGPTKLILPVRVRAPRRPGRCSSGAHELLDQLYEETERLLHEKEPAIHYLARALIERDELIGDELEAVFTEIEATYPYLRRPFERKVLQFRPFGRDMRPEETPREPEAEEEAAAADAPAADGRTGTGRRTWQPPRPPGVASGSSRGDLVGSRADARHADRRRAALGAPLATSGRTRQLDRCSPASLGPEYLP